MRDGITERVCRIWMRPQRCQTLKQMWHILQNILLGNSPCVDAGDPSFTEIDSVIMTGGTSSSI